VRRFAQDDDFVGRLKKNTPNRLTLVGLRPGLSSAVPVRQAQGRLCGTQLLKAAGLRCKSQVTYRNVTVSAVTIVPRFGEMLQESIPVG
jgi:hypothetical protein